MHRTNIITIGTNTSDIDTICKQTCDNKNGQ